VTPQKDRPPVNPVELAVCSAVAPLLEAAGVPDPDEQPPQVLGWLRRFGFAVAFRGDPVDAATTDRYLAMALDTTIVQGHGGPRTCEDRTRDAAALRHRLHPVGLHLARIRPQWPSCRPAPPRVARPPLTTRSPTMSENTAQHRETAPAVAWHQVTGCAGGVR